MAITDINVSGKLFQDDGDPVEGATVQLLETGTTTVEATYSGGTTAAGLWAFTETSLDATYDVKLTSGTSVRYILWSDEIALKGVDTASLKIRGTEGAAAPLYFFADQADDAGDGWRIQASASDTLAIGSNKASATAIVDYLTITNGANAAASTVTVGGILTVTTTLDVNGTADYDVTDYDIASSGDIDLVSTNNAVGAIYLRENAGTSGTIKIHADQGTSVTAGAESVTILSDAGGVGIRSTANLANAVNITADGGTTSTIQIFNDQGTSVTEGAASIQLLSDAGGIGIKSTANLAGAILLTADGGTSETIKVHADQGTSESSIQLLSDAGGVDINAATGKDVDIAGGTVNLTSSDNAASAIYLRANAGTSETIKIHADQGTGAASISAVSDAGGITLDAGLDIVLSADGGNVTMDDGTSTIFDFDVDGTTLTIHDDQDTGDKAVITMAQHGALSIVTTDDDAAAANIQITADGTAELAGTTVTLDSAGDIELEATNDVVIPANVGITFGSGEKIEGDNTDLFIISGDKIYLSATSDVFMQSGVGLVLDGSGSEKIESDGTDISISVGSNGDINIPSAIGLTFADDGQKIESDGTDFTVASGAKLNLAATSDVHIANGTGLVVGHTAQVNPWTIYPEVQVLGTAQPDSTVVIGRYTSGSAGGELYFLKSKATTIGGSGLVADGDDIGIIRFIADDGTDLASEPARILGEIDGTAEGNVTPGRLTFWTCGSGNTPTERMRIANDGGVFFSALLAASASTDVNINGSDELHSVTSSEYYKYDKRSLDFDSSLIYQLEPRSYRFGSKKPDAPASWPESEGETDDWGLTAEEVYQVLPELVNMRDGKPYSVRYSMLSVLLLAEVQKLKAAA